MFGSSWGYDRKVRPWGQLAQILTFCRYGNWGPETRKDFSKVTQYSSCSSSLVEDPPGDFFEGRYRAGTLIRKISWRNIKLLARGQTTYHVIGTTKIFFTWNSLLCFGGHSNPTDTVGSDKHWPAEGIFGEPWRTSSSAVSMPAGLGALGPGPRFLSLLTSILGQCHLGQDPTAWPSSSYKARKQTFLRNSSVADHPANLSHPIPTAP